jgi:hypothetical protein
MKLDMNFDYNWYYNYYMNSYAMGPIPYSAANSSLSAAYYAQYAMLTSYDYNHSDLSNWMQQRGYTLDNNQYINSFNEQNVKSSEEIIDSNQEKDLNLIKTEVSSESNKVEPPSDSITTNLSLEDSEVKVIVILWFVYYFISNLISFFFQNRLNRMICQIIFQFKRQLIAFLKLNIRMKDRI